MRWESERLRRVWFCSVSSGETGEEGHAKEYVAVGGARGGDGEASGDEGGAGGAEDGKVEWWGW